MTQSALWSGVVAVLLSGVYFAGSWLYSRESKHPRRWLSLASGASMAYVFLDVLPELSEHNRQFMTSHAGGSILPDRLYAVALLGFIVLYGVDHLSRLAKAARERSRAGDDAGSPVFWTHIAGFTLYGWVIGDVLVIRAAAGPTKLLLYAGAMVLHLAVVASSLAREHGRVYDARGRWVLAASVLIGWLMAVFMPLSETTMSRLFALVAGGVIMTSANEELPREKEGRFWWFAGGAVACGSLLLLV